MPLLSVRFAVGALLASAASLVVPGTANDATCGGAHGVSVVVDFHDLGGVQTACDANGAGETAARQFTDGGHTLTYVQRQPGFVCRVDGAPSSDPCVNTPPSDSYWSVWWSDGKSGRWSYSSQGVGSLQVPDGGYVALSWQGSSSKAPPRAAATAHRRHTPAPSPSGTPTAHHTQPSPTARPTSPASSAPRTAATSGPTATGSTTAGPPSRSTASAAPVTRRHHTARLKAAHPSHSPKPTSTEAGAPLNSSAPAASGSGVPGWVAPGLVGLVFVSAATVAVVRRKRSGGA